MEWTCAACGTTAIVEHARLLHSMGWQITRTRTCLCAVCVQRSDSVVRAAREMRRRAVQMGEQSRQMISDARGSRLRVLVRRGFE